MFNAPHDFLLVYSSRELGNPWWAKWVDRHFAHVDIWVPIGEGCYAVVRPQFDLLHVTFETRVAENPQEHTTQWVHAARPLGFAMFPIGVRTCVTVAKSMLGIRDWRIQTPRQLYNFIRRRNGQVG